jgi:hypothetical protein
LIQKVNKKIKADGAFERKLRIENCRTTQLLVPRQTGLLTSAIPNFRPCFLFKTPVGRSQIASKSAFAKNQKPINVM